MLRLALVGAVVGLLACMGRGSTVDFVPTSAETEAALLNYLITERYSPEGRIVCVAREVPTGDGRERRDADPETLERLNRSGLEVAPGSECRLRDVRGPMLHTPSGRPAVLYVTALVGGTSERSEFIGAWYAGSLDSASCDYIVTHQNEAFQIVQDGACIVS